MEAWEQTIVDEAIDYIKNKLPVEQAHLEKLAKLIDTSVFTLERKSRDSFTYKDTASGATRTWNSLAIASFADGAANLRGIGSAVSCVVSDAIDCAELAPWLTAITPLLVVAASPARVILVVHTRSENDDAHIREFFEVMGRARAIDCAVYSL